MTRYFIRETFYLNLSEKMLQYTFIPFYSDRLACRCYVNTHSDFFCQRDFKEVCVEQFPFRGINLIILDKGKFIFTVCKMKIDHNLTTRGCINKLRHFFFGNLYRERSP